MQPVHILSFTTHSMGAGIPVLCNFRQFIGLLNPY